MRRHIPQQRPKLAVQSKPLAALMVRFIDTSSQYVRERIAIGVWGREMLRSMLSMQELQAQARALNLPDQAAAEPQPTQEQPT